MMGDNRNDSLDSRYFGTIPQEDILYKALFYLDPIIEIPPTD